MGKQLKDEDDADKKPAQEEQVEVEQQESDTKNAVEVVEADERPAEAAADEQDEHQSRQRETAKERRERAKKAKERDKRELDFQRREISRLDAKIAELSRSQVVGRANQLDVLIKQQKERAAQFESIAAAAITKNQGQDAVDAQRLRDEANDIARRAEWERHQLAETARAPQQEQAPAYLPYARKFMRDNAWYNNNDDSEDTLIVKAIDAAVAKEYDAADPEYWDELQRRVKKRLPQHFEDDEDELEDEPVKPSQARKGPPTGGSSRGNSATSGKQILLSRERVEALKEAGLWDDPKTRQRMAQRYAEQDRLRAAETA